MKNIKIIGTLCSILGLAWAIISYATPINQTVNNNSGYIIGENNGGVNINYAPNSDQNDQLILKNPKYGVSLVISVPDLSVIQDKTKHVCSAIAGTPIELTGRVTEGNVLPFKEVKIIKGECAGKIGWASPQNITFK